MSKYKGFRCSGASQLPEACTEAARLKRQGISSLFQAGNREQCNLQKDCLAQVSMMEGMIES